MVQFNVKAPVWLAVTAALGLACAPSIAQATEFTPEGSAYWMRIARTLTYTIDSGNDQTSVCEGINAFAGMRADFRREVITMQGWAPQAHFQICTAFHANVGSSNVKCASFKRAVNLLAKAQPATDPAQVVAVSVMLKESVVSMIADLEDAKLC